MDTWTLKIDLNGEWEQCSFYTRKDAIAAFIAISKDYPLKLRRAILLSPASSSMEALPRQPSAPQSKFLN